MATAEYYRRYYKKNRARIAETQKRFRLRHPGYHTKYVVAWQKRNPQRVKANASAWHEAHPEYYKARLPRKRVSDLQRIFKKRFGGLREQIIQRDGERCVICNITRRQHRRKYGRDICVDHKDGSGLQGKQNRNGRKVRPNNNPKNLRTLCLVCNLKVAREANFTNQSIIHAQ